MSVCKHRNAIGLLTRRVTRVPNSLKGRMMTRVCPRCGLVAVTWPLGIATANDQGIEHEILAARLYAGFETGDDRDDVLENPITHNVLEAMTGSGPIRSTTAQEVYDLHEAMRETGESS